MHRFARAALACGILLAAASAVFASGGWDGGYDWITGSGTVRSEDRAIPSFTSIEVEGPGNVTLSQGIGESVSVDADDNILPVVKTEVVDNVLHLGFANDVHVRRITRLEFHVTVRQLNAITISGSGGVHSATLLRSDALSLEIRGSGRIDAEAEVGDLQARIAGSGDIELAGRAKRLAVTIDGSGAFMARDLASASADLRIYGSGDAAVSAADTITITLTGSGNVEYSGGAKATIKASGSGTIRQL